MFEEGIKGDTPTAEEMLELANSMRGRYILSQALHYGIAALEAVEPEEVREESNIADMKLLYEYAFPLFKLVHEMEQKLGNKPDFCFDTDTGETLRPKGD